VQRKINNLRKEHDMPQLKELLVEQLQDLLHAEGQLTGALPKMAEAAHHPKLKEAFEKHLAQTEMHVERLRRVFEMLREEAEPKPCKAMMGLIEEGKETIEEGGEKEPIAADLALIAAAQRVEHYEIACYGTVRGLARQIGQVDAARLLTQTLGEEEASDFLLTAISDPLIQQAAMEDSGNTGNLENGDKRGPARATRKAEKMASRGR
jgi:Mn-containing catalase